MISVQHPMRRHNDYTKLREQRDNVIFIDARPNADDIANLPYTWTLWDWLSTILIGFAILWGLRVFVWPVFFFWLRNMGIFS